MSKILVKLEIDPPDDEHCMNPKSRRKFDHCRYFDWPSVLDVYDCDLFRRKLKGSNDGTVKRPKWCWDKELNK